MKQVDTRDLKSLAARRAGSTPASGTNFFNPTKIKDKMDTFEFKTFSEDDGTELTLKTSSWHFTLDEILEKFANFLKGAGFQVEGELQFVTDEETDEDGFFTGIMIEDDDTEDDDDDTDGEEDEDADSLWSKLDVENGKM